mgnify:CR=1 FL=1
MLYMIKAGVGNVFHWAYNFDNGACVYLVEKREKEQKTHLTRSVLLYFARETTHRQLLIGLERANASYTNDRPLITGLGWNLAAFEELYGFSGVAPYSSISVQDFAFPSCVDKEASTVTVGGFRVSSSEDQQLRYLLTVRVFDSQF